jgi:nickel transport system substrate-binding protein
MNLSLVSSSHKRTFIGFILLLTLMLLTVACGSQQSSNKVINVSWNKDVGSLNPHMYNPSQFFAQAMVFESLVQYGEQGKIEPMLAESWEISEDGKTHTFKLRKNVKYSDGSPFNAGNAKRNFDAVLKNREAHSWMELINQIESTSAPNDETFIITLKNKYMPTLQELTYVRPVRFLADSGFPEDDDTSKGIIKAIGTGPWILNEYIKDKKAVFKRNPNYWGSAPNIDEVIVNIIPDGEARALALQNGELDLIYGIGLINLDTFKSLNDSGEFKTAVSEPLATRTLVLNSARGYTQDRAVRTALQHGLDKQSIIDYMFHGIEKRADQLMSPEIPYVDAKLQPYEYNPDKAKQLLDEAGWVLNNQTNIREKDGKPLQLSLRYIRSDSMQSTLAETVKSNYAKIGIQIELVGEEEQQFWDNAFAGNFDMLFDETWGAPYDPHSYLSAMRKDEHSSSSYQAQKGLVNLKQYHAWIDQALITIDESERQRLYQNVLKGLHDEAIYIPISYQVNIAVYREETLKSFQFPSTHYEFPWNEIELK